MYWILYETEAKFKNIVKTGSLYEMIQYVTQPQRTDIH